MPPLRGLTLLSCLLPSAYQFIMDTSNKEQPEVLSSEEVFDGKLISVVRDTVREGEKTYLREVVKHPGGAAVVPFFEDGSVAFVSQYRHPARKYVLELPAGQLAPGGRAPG